MEKFRLPRKLKKQKKIYTALRLVVAQLRFADLMSSIAVNMMLQHHKKMNEFIKKFPYGGINFSDKNDSFVPVDEPVIDIIGWNQDYSPVYMVEYNSFDEEKVKDLMGNLRNSKHFSHYEKANATPSDWLLSHGTIQPNNHYVGDLNNLM